MASIYFNHQQTARPSREVEKRMIPYLRGKESDAELKQAYSALHRLVESDRFIFTSSGAEAINHVIFAAYLDMTRKTGKDHFITPNTEEAPTIMAMDRLQQLGAVFQMVPTDRSGYVTCQAVAETITPRTAMLSLAWANGLTGVIQPVAQIGELCRDRGILFHVDATHVLGKGDYTLEASGADVLTFNGEQLHGPRGTGGIYIRDGLEISPFILGEGSLNLAGLIGLGQAAHEAADYFCMEVIRLRHRFEQLVLAQIPNSSVLFQESNRVPHITTFTFPGVGSEPLLYLLQRKGVCASFGGGNFQQLRHLLKACGVEEPLCYSGLSFAFSRETTEEEVEKGATILTEVVQHLQNCSRYL